MKFSLSTSAGLFAPYSRLPLAQPSRKSVAPTGRQFRAKFYSQKCARLIQCESLLEMKAAQLFEFSPHVACFSEQPPPLNIVAAGRRRRYTPDFLVELRSGARYLVEVKPSELAERPEMSLKLTAAAAVAESLGFRFCVLTEKHARSRGAEAIPRLLAIRLRIRTSALGSHARRGDLASDRPTIPSAVALTLASSGSIRLHAAQALLGGGEAATEMLLELIAFGALRWDLDTPLDERAELTEPLEDAHVTELL